MTALPPELQTLGRSIRLGRWWYLMWHQPRAAIARSWREGGPVQQWLDARGHRAMKAAAARLPATTEPPAGAPKVAFLTGRKFWHQTAFCCWSLHRHAGSEFQPVFIDDGTFDPALRAECLRVFPGARIEGKAEITQRLDRHLPTGKFPALRERRLTYIHLRKLTDAHAGGREWQVVLDSDMLFFRRPDALLAWLAAPDRPVHMLDVQDAYGYPEATLSALAGQPIPHLVNVGVCGLHSGEMDWRQLEEWCAELMRRHGSSYYLEQALVALLLAGKGSLQLPREDYLLMPGLAECQRPTAALHHYVALSKRGYFRYGWQHLSPA